MLVGGVIVVGAFTGVASVHSAKLAVVVLAALIAAALVVRRPITLAVLAVPGTLIVQRLGAATSTPGAAGGITYSDALMAGAALLSLPALVGTPQPARLRLASAGAVVYLASLAPSLMLNRSMHGDLEWAHRAVLLLGSLFVGAWLVREQTVDQSLRLLFRLAAFIGIAAVVNSASHGFAAAEPFGLNKNFIGGMLGMVLILSATIGRRIEPTRWVRVFVTVACLAGLIASLSRGGMIGAAFGLVIAFFADAPSHRRRTRAAVLAASGVLLVVAAISIRDQFRLKHSDFLNSSAGQRLTVEAATRRIWSTSPIVGVGLRYYSTGNYPGAIASNNVIDNELAESGIFGAGGFVILQAGVVVALLRRRREPMAGAALGLVGGQLLHGMVDIYWSAGVVSLPFLVAGLALSADAPATGRVIIDPERARPARDPAATAGATASAGPVGSVRRRPAARYPG